MRFKLIFSLFSICVWSFSNLAVKAQDRDFSFGWREGTVCVGCFKNYWTLKSEEGRVIGGFLDDRQRNRIGLSHEEREQRRDGDRVFIPVRFHVSPKGRITSITRNEIPEFTQEESCRLLEVNEIDQLVSDSEEALHEMSHRFGHALPIDDGEIHYEICEEYSNIAITNSDRHQVEVIEFYHHGDNSIRPSGTASVSQR